MICNVQQIAQGTLYVDTATAIVAAAVLATTPASFTLTDIKPFSDLIADLAWQAGCILRYDGTSFVVSPIFVEPVAAISTITLNDDIIVQGKIIDTYPETVDLTDSVEFTWKPTGKDENVKSYIAIAGGSGYRTDSWDLSAYDSYLRARNAAAFWLVREGCLWRRYECVCTLKALDYRVFDVITVNIPGHTPTGTWYGEVREVSWNPRDNTVDVTVQIPVKVGSEVGDADYWTTLSGDYINRAAVFSKAYSNLSRKRTKSDSVNQKDDVNLFKRYGEDSPTQDGFKNTELKKGDALLWDDETEMWQPGEAGTGSSSGEMFDHSHSGPGDGGHLAYFMET